MRPSSAGATLPTDDGATFDRSITIDADALEPMITYGTNPGMGIPITSRGPLPDRRGRSGAASRARARARVHGPAARAADPRPEGRRRVRRVVHERAHQRPAAGGRRAQGPARRRRRAPDGHARQRRGEARGRARGPRRRLQGGRRRLARVRLLDVHRDERRPADARPVRGEHVATATSRVARARAAGPSWRRRSTAAATAITGVVTDPRTLPGIETLAAVGGR